MENNKQQLTEFLKQYPDVFTIEESENLLRVKPTDKIKDINIEKFANDIFDLETKLANEDQNYISLDLKGLDVPNLEKIIKVALKKEDLADPLMILNIMNLIKIYNTLNSTFFENKDVYVFEISNLLDIRLDLQEELEDFIKQLSIYYISLFKSYNKVMYTPLDIHKPLPKLFKTIFLTSNTATLAGIFASSKPFSTEDCIYLDDALECIYALKEKDAIEFNLMSDFIGKQNGNAE